MAIEKKIINEVNGVSTEYHRISDVSFDLKNKKLAIVFSSYLDESKRDKEKKALENNKKLDALYEELDRLVKNPTPDNELERRNLSAQINDMNYDNTPATNVSEEVIEITLTDEEKNSIVKNLYGMIPKDNELADGKEV